MDKRLFILLGITLGLLLLYMTFANDKKHEGPRPPQAEKVEKKAEAPKPAEPIKQRPLEPSGPRPSEETASLSTDRFEAVFSTRGGSLVSWKLKEPRFRREKDGKKAPVDLVTTNTKDFEENNPLRLELLTGGEEIPIKADYELVAQGPDEVKFLYAKGPIRITKKFAKAKEPYQIWLTATIENTTAEPRPVKAAILMQGYQDPNEAKGSYFGKPPDPQQGICRAAGQTFRGAAKNLEHAFSAPAEVGYTAVGTNYFIDVMVPGKNENGVGCYVQLTSLLVIRSELQYTQQTLKPGEEVTYRVRVYMGPKFYSLLQKTGHELVSSIDLGFFEPICKVLLWFLQFFQGWVVNWGVAIILLTILVKIILWPLTQRSYKSMEEMKRIKPLIDEVNETYKDDATKKSEVLMALYKEHKINPLGGCLPMLLQMPIWFALYRTLASAADLYRAPFAFWLQDLSSPDPYYITPLVLGASMFIQQKMTPTTGDNAQAKMMLYFMPAMFTAFMLFLPSGLTLYILVNTFLSIAQQKLIGRKMTGKTPLTVGRQGGPALPEKRRVRK